MTINLKRVEVAAFSPDGRLFATVGSRVSVWDFASQERVHDLRVGRYPYHVVFSPSRPLLMVKSTSGQLTAVDLTSGEQTNIGRAVGEGAAPVFTSDGRYLVDATWDSQVRVFDVETWAVVREASSAGNSLRRISRSAGDVFVASQSPFPVAWNGKPGHILVWQDLREEPRTVRLDPEFVVWDAIVHPDGETAFVVGLDSVHRVDLATGRLLGELIGKWETCSFRADGSKLLAVHKFTVDRDKRPYSLKGGLMGAAGSVEQLALVDSATMETEAAAYFPNVYDAQFSPDGRLVFVRADPNRLMTIEEFLDYSRGIGPSPKTSR